MQILGTERSFYTTKESNPHNTGLGPQHGRRFIVLYTSVTSVAVVFPFYPWFKFYFSLFWGMVMSIMSLKAAVRFKRSIGPLLPLNKQFLEVVSC